MTSPKIVQLWDLAHDFDDDLAKSMLEVIFDKIIHPQDAVEKSLYNFDLETPEGVDRLLELLPIMDPEIINEVYAEIFPGYPVDTLAPRIARIELRGYLMDYLNGNFEEGQEAKEAAEAAEPPGLDEEPESESSTRGDEAEVLGSVQREAVDNVSTSPAGTTP